MDNQVKNNGSVVRPDDGKVADYTVREMIQPLGVGEGPIQFFHNKIIALSFVHPCEGKPFGFNWNES